jgi:hypothetical protein
MTFDTGFKKALQLLPEHQKDKLILRLLKHDLQLANKLRFELLDTDTVQEFSIPKNIADIHKELRENGFLK